MSHMLRVKYKSPDREGFSIPVALHATFKYEWLPASRELELKLIPLFGTGYPLIELNRETMPLVIDELRMLQAYLVDEFPANSEQTEKRFTSIIAVLEQVLDEFDEIEYVRV